MSNDSNAPALFEELQSSFLAALHSLSQEGVFTDVGQAVDILHDFYICEWEKVLAGYDPAKGKLSSYALAALKRFARRRATRDAIFRQALEWDDGHLGSGSVEQCVDTHDLEILKTALGGLSPVHRKCVMSIFEEPSLDERTLARLLGTTRYRIRQYRVEAIGELAIRLEALGGLTSFQRDVADALFVQHMSIAAAASALKTSNREIREMRDQLILHFKSLLGRGRHVWQDHLYARPNPC